MLDDNDLVKQYYKSIDKAITNVNKKEDFKLRFLIALSKGEVRLSHQIKKTVKKYRDDWIKQIEGTMEFLQNVVYNPKRFIRQEEAVVPVELAKKTGKESIQHLSSNTQFIAEVNADGVRPSKVLIVHKEEDYAIYENRFIKMLINRMTSFVDHRYSFITDRLDGRVENSFEVEMDAKLGKADVTSTIKYDITYNEEEESAHETYKRIITRVEKIRVGLYQIRNSEFMKQLANARPIAGTIQITNILGKEVNYKKCFELWHYINKYDSSGFDIEVTQEIIPFDDAYKEDVYNMLMLGYSSVKVNSDKVYDDGFEGEIKRVKTFSPKVDKKFIEVSDDDYIYEEEFRIPTKIELLENIKEEQERLEKALARQKELEERAIAKIEELRKLRDEKIKKEKAKEQARIRREKAKSLRDAERAKKQRLLEIEKEKEARRNEVRKQIKRRKETIAKINKNIKMYVDANNKLKVGEIKINEQIAIANANIKKYRDLIRKKENVTANKNRYYINLFRLNELKSKMSDGKIAKKQYDNMIIQLNEKLEREKDIEKELNKKLKNI